LDKIKKGVLCENVSYLKTVSITR